MPLFAIGLSNNETLEDMFLSKIQFFCRELLPRHTLAVSKI